MTRMGGKRTSLTRSIWSGVLQSERRQGAKAKREFCASRVI